MKPRDAAHEIITQSIRRHGYHVYVVSGGPVPRWAYTVGLSQGLGHELVLAGSAALLKESVLQLLKALSSGGEWQTTRKFANDLGEFTVSPVSGAWGAVLLAGANDYYSRPVAATQIVPMGTLATIDVPILAIDHVQGTPSAWRWLFEPWPFEIPRNSEVMVDTHVLHGAAATEAARWEPDYWEVFSGPADRVSKQDARLLPLGALVGHDPSLEILATLGVGEAVRRSEGGEWQAWVENP